jgi:hypothetical protein
MTSREERERSDQLVAVASGGSKFCISRTDKPGWGPVNGGAEEDARRKLLDDVP